MKMTRPDAGGARWQGINGKPWLNTDIVAFSQGFSFNPLTIDPGRNIRGIIFDTADVGSTIVGTTTGNALVLTSGGSIQTSVSVVSSQQVNAPLVLEGNYAFNSGSSTPSATLNFGGAISPDPTLGSLTTLTLTGANTGANAIDGVLADNGSAQLGLTVQGSTWVLSQTNTYSGPTTVSGGTLQIGNGTSGTLNPASAISISSAGSLVVAPGGSISTNTIGVAGGHIRD